MMKIRNASILLLLTLLSGLLVPIHIAKAAQSPISQRDTVLSKQSFLNADGTLKLDGSLNGSLDLKGYRVQLDPQRGPIFYLAENDETDLQASSTGEWSSLGGGREILNSVVDSIAVNGSDVYVGGNFTDAAGIPAADYIAKWDGMNWSALGSNGAGDGSLNGTVMVISINGSNIYVGGAFTNVNNSGAILQAGDKIARWDGTNWSALGYGSNGDGSISDWVFAIAISGSNIYAGGMFTHVNDQGTVLNTADYIAHWNGSHWSSLGNNGAGDSSLNNYVRAIAVIGTDVFAGGDFINVNNYGTVLTAADFIARWNGSNWSALGSNGQGDGALNSPVYALAASGTSLYVGGYFTNVHNSILELPSADYVARWDGLLWSALGTGSGNGSLNGKVHAILINGPNIYVGGNFTDVNNKGTVLKEADYAARWDGSNWSALADNGYGDGSLNQEVFAIAAGNPGIVVGGPFTSANHHGEALNAASYLAIWNGTGWAAPTGSVLNGSIHYPVFAIAIQGTDVFVGGGFTNVSDGEQTLTTADYIVKWDGSHWSALGSNGAGDGSLNSPVFAIAVNGSDVYAGGWFSNVNNNGTILTAADFIAKWDGSNWSALGSDGVGGGSLNNRVSAIAISGSNVYAGGLFMDVKNNGQVRTSADFIARWDGSNWYPLLGNGVNEGSLNNFVNAIAVSGSNVYVGGGFKDVNNGGVVLTAADYIARWDGTNWSALGSNGAGDGAITNGVVNAIVVNSTGVYAGGTFTDVHNNGTVLSAADFIAKWDGSSWSALGRDGAGNGSIKAPGTGVLSLAINGSDVYVGGDILTVENNGEILTAAGNIAHWDGSNWLALGEDGSGGSSIGDLVSAIAVDNSGVYIGGEFTDVNNRGKVLPAADHIALFRMESNRIYLPMLIR